MTGRRLYDHYCDSHKATRAQRYEAGEGWISIERLVAWPFLCTKEREMWNDLARRLKPKAR